MQFILKIIFFPIAVSLKNLFVQETLIIIQNLCRTLRVDQDNTWVLAEPSVGTGAVSVDDHDSAEELLKIKHGLKVLPKNAGLSCSRETELHLDNMKYSSLLLRLSLMSLLTL